jgi:hypothetical protein
LECNIADGELNEKVDFALVLRASKKSLIFLRAWKKVRRGMPSSRQFLCFSHA